MTIRVLSIGAGNMGRSHTLAYHQIPGFEVAGICTRSTESSAKLASDLQIDCPTFDETFRKPCQQPNQMQFVSHHGLIRTPNSPKQLWMLVVICLSKSRWPIVSRRPKK